MGAAANSADPTAGAASQRGPKPAAIDGTTVNGVASPNGGASLNGGVSKGTKVPVVEAGSSDEEEGEAAAQPRNSAG
eukprot:scaffold316959_cov19-Tisochrysis_lutea.AAC.1